MSEEDQNVEVVLPVKSDMHSYYLSTYGLQGCKRLSLQHNIPLRCAPLRALTAEWTMDKLTDDFIGLYEQYFEFSGVRVPFSTLLLAVLDHFRVHISQLVPIGLTRLTLFELYCRSLHIVPSVNLFRVFYKIGKQGDWFTFERRRHHDSDIHDPLPTDGFRASDVVTLTDQSIDIRPVPSGLLSKIPRGMGDALSARDAITSHTTGKEKARAAAKKRAERKIAAGGEGGSKGKPKRRKVFAVRAEEEDSTEEASSASPLRTVAPNPSFLLKGITTRALVSQEDMERRLRLILPMRPLGLTEKSLLPRNPEKKAVQDLVPVVRSNLADHADGARYPPVLVSDLCSISGPSTKGLEWTLLRNGVMAQTDALLRFEALYDAHLALKERYISRAVNADQVSQIKELEAELARKDSALVFSDRVSNERAVENERLVSKLGYFEKEKIDSIGKLLPTVAGWAKGLAVKRSEEDLMDVLREVQGFDPLLRYKDGLEYDKLFYQTYPFVEKNSRSSSSDCPRSSLKMYPPIKDITVKRSEEDLMDVLREVQGFDPHSDTRMAVEYDKLFTKTYPFVEKISGLPRRTVQELLKMYPAPPPQDAPTKVNPSSQAPDGSKSVPPRG
ncbi:hypothetical protein Tco_0641756 [Tanacetum coccineum]